MVDSAGFLTHHMAIHILAMNVAAPVLIIAWRMFFGGESDEHQARWIAPAGALQILLLWGWHMPAPFAFALSTPGGEALMQGSLMLSALWFWYGVFNEAEAARWRALIALLVTGKLFCLLGALLTFAPRPLYPRAAGTHMSSQQLGDALLADQQLAGLLMLIACPLTYVLAGVILAARWIHDIEQRTGQLHQEKN